MRHLKNITFPKARSGSKKYSCRAAKTRTFFIFILCLALTSFGSIPSYAQAAENGTANAERSADTSEKNSAANTEDTADTPEESGTANAKHAAGNSEKDI